MTPWRRGTFSSHGREHGHGEDGGSIPLGGAHARTRSVRATRAAHASSVTGKDASSLGIRSARRQSVSWGRRRHGAAHGRERESAPSHERAASLG